METVTVTKKRKISIDMDEELFYEIMNQGNSIKMYKVGPIILHLLRKGLDSYKETK